jgi:hypothetical protein
MSINPLAVDAAFTIEKRGIYYAILVSACLHLVAFYFPYPRPLPHTMPTPEEVASPLRVQLRAPRKPPERAAETQVLSEILVNSSRKKKPVSLAVPQQLKALKKLRISREDMEAAIRPPDAADNDWNGLSDNGAIVIKPDLLARLNQSERRLGLMPDDRAPQFNSSFSAGAWTDFVRIGNTCFRVIQANPLEPVPQETWYRIKCSL